MRHKIDALGALVRIVQIERRRHDLIANGEDVGEDVWGDFIVKEYFDENDEIVVV